MLTALVLILVVMVFVGMLTSSIDRTAKGVESLTALLKRLDAWLAAKVKAQREAERRKREPW
jgi:hypothetical protein